jgi:hypothetical protein
MVSVLLLTGFVTNVYAAETLDLGVPSSVVGAQITVSGIPGQTGESVTDVDLTPSPCSIQNDITCTGFSDVAIPGIGEGHLLVILHNHKATATHPAFITPVMLFIISTSLVFLPTILSPSGITMFGANATAPMTTPVGIGQVTIQLS